MPSRIINIDGIEVTLRKSGRAKHIIISVQPYKGVQVSIPERASFSEGERVAQEKIDWIRSHQTKIEKHEQKILEEITKPGPVTRSHMIELIPADTEKISVKVFKGIIKVKHPVSLTITSLSLQKAISVGIEKAYREEAKEFLPKRLNDLSDRFNLPYNEVYIKNIKSRWGSCSSKNNINLSIHLMRLPDRLIDYVLLHELAHTKVRNHSKTFWNFLDSLTGDSKYFDKELKKHRIH